MQMHRKSFTKVLISVLLAYLCFTRSVPKSANLTIERCMSIFMEDAAHVIFRFRSVKVVSEWEQIQQIYVYFIRKQITPKIVTLIKVCYPFVKQVLLRRISM